MFNKDNRSSRNAIKLENETEEKLLEKIAKIQNLLKEVDDNSSDSVKEMSSSNEENNEPRRKYHDRTRYNSPLTSVRPVTPAYDDSNDCKSEFNRFLEFDTKYDANPFSLPSTSQGYSASYANVFDPTYGSPNLSPKLERKPPIEDNDDDWVPLTFLDKNPKKPSRRRTPPMTYKPPKNVDLSYQTQMERNRRERNERPDRHSSRHGERRHKKRYYFPEIAEKRRKKRRIKEEKRRKEAEENYKKQQMELEESEKAIVVNPLSLIKKEIDSDDDDDDDDSDDDYDSDKNYYDSDKNDYDSDKNYDDNLSSNLKPNYYNKNYNEEIERIYEDDNYKPNSRNSTETTGRKRKKEQNYPQIKKQRLSDDDYDDVEVDDFKSSRNFQSSTKKIKEETEDVKPNINMLKNLGKNFNACVSIASKIPDEALNFLNLIPFDKIKQEKTNSSNLTKSTSSSSSSPSTSTRNISTSVDNFKNQKNPSQHREMGNSRKIDFSNELRRFSRKLQKIRNEEENY
ncbi:protein PFC0760c-like [Leptopilina heterotoma]|uniref:protein PFC0760c-like n=1 Tax=Leptopilina heterotoma TaxID=63436 RepID=UPI001CA9AB89|nr:protein PFC0760c-like [Leptopilina heterotoma]